MSTAWGQGGASWPCPLRRMSYSPVVTACPACGGGQRRLLSPGWFECTSPISVEAPMVFDPGFGGFRPAGPPTTRACAHRYQEGRAHTGQPPCWCGVLAIGHCTSCRQSVCGVHSEQVPQLLCGACWARWNAERQRRSAHEQAAAREKRVAQEAAEIEARKQAARRRQVQLEALPAADLNDVQRYLAHGRGQVAPTDWSLRAGVRLEPLPFAVLPKLLLVRRGRSFLAVDCGTMSNASCAAGTS